MPPIDALTAFLDQPVWLGFGKIGPIAGNIPLLHELSDKKKVGCTIVGAGVWDDLERFFAGRKAIALPDTTRVHFHRGEHGEIGAGMTPSSNGPDQKVDNFFSDLPGGLDKVSFSGYAHTFFKLDPDPGAPGPDLELLGHYKAMRCRIFDDTGAQTSFAFTENPAWWICHLLLLKFIKRHSRFNEPLTSEEKARFNWSKFDAAADDLAADSDFNNGGIVWREPVDAQAALEDLLWFSRCYLIEVDGKFELYFDKDRASEMTLYAGDIEPGSFRGNKRVLPGAKNQITVKFRDNGLASGSSDELTRYAIASTEQLNHRTHQKATGVRGAGLAALPNVQPLVFDYAEGRAVCCAKPARMWRLAKHHLVRQLGDEVAPGETYAAPWDCEFVAAERTLRLLPGDIVTIDKSVSEEFGGVDYEILTIRQLADGRRRMTAKQKVAAAYPATAPTQQATQAPTPGTGLAPITSVDSSGVQGINSVPFDKGNLGVETTGEIVLTGLEINTTGWRVIDTDVIEIPNDEPDIVFTLDIGTTGTGSVAIDGAGNNIGIAIYDGAPPASPTFSRAGDGDITYTDPPKGSHNIALYVKCAAGAVRVTGTAAVKRKIPWT